MAESAFKGYLMLIPKLASGATSAISSALSSKNYSSVGSGIGSKLAGGIMSSVKSISIGNVAADLIGNAMSAVASSIGDAVSRVDTLKSFPTVMQNMGISADAANASIQAISKGIEGLPTTLDSAAAGVQRLTAANGDIDLSTKYFLAMNDAIVAGGQSSDIQATAIEQLSQAYSKGSMDMTEWRSLMTAMPAQLTQVASAMGMTADQLGEGLRTGGVSMDAFMSKMVELDTTGTGSFASFSQQAQGATSGIGTSFTNLQTAVTRNLADIIAAIDGDEGRISGFANSVAQGIDSAGGAIADFISANIGPAIESVQQFGSDAAAFFAPLADAFSSIGEGIQAGFGPFVEAMGPTVLSVLEGIGGFITTVGEGFVQFGATVGEALGPLVQAIGELFTAIATALQPLVDLLMPALQAIGEALKTVLSIIGQILAVVINVVATIISVIAQIITVVAEFVANVIATVSGFVASVVGFFQGLWNSIVGVVSSIVSSVVGFFQGLWDGVVSIVSGIVSSVVGFFQGLWDGVCSAVSGLVSGVVGFFQNLWSSITGAVSGMWNSVVSGFSSGVSNAISTVAGLPGRICDFFAGAGTWLIDAGKSVIRGFIDGIKSMFSAIGDAVSGALSAVTNLMPHSPAKEGPLSGKGWTLYSGQATMEAFGEGIADAAEDARLAASDAMAGVKADMDVAAQYAVSAQAGGAGAALGNVTNNYSINGLSYNDDAGVNALISEFMTELIRRQRANLAASRG